MDAGDIIWTVILLVSAFGATLVKAFRRAIKDMPQPVATPAQNKKPIDFSTEEKSSAPSQEASNEPFSEEYGTDDYFSYETVNTPVVDLETEDTPSVAAAILTPQDEPVREEDSINFNLRQAIIYQTILHNNYITEINR